MRTFKELTIHDPLYLLKIDLPTLSFTWSRIEIESIDKKGIHFKIGEEKYRIATALDNTHSEYDDGTVVCTSYNVARQATQHIADKLMQSLVPLTAAECADKLKQS